MGWTLSPALAELAPATMAYLYDAASPGVHAGTRRGGASPTPPANTDGRDVFVAAVSGYGYAYPDLLANDAARLAALSSASSQFLGKSDMRVVNILGAGDSGPTDGVASAFLSLPTVDAIIWCVTLLWSLC